MGQVLELAACIRRAPGAEEVSHQVEDSQQDYMRDSAPRLEAEGNSWFQGSNVQVDMLQRARLLGVH